MDSDEVNFLFNLYWERSEIMKYQDLPERWKIRLSRFLRDVQGEERDELNANDFKAGLKITFPDGSRAHFYFAFAIADEELGELAVFTEHCGYHLFPLYETTWVASNP